MISPNAKRSFVPSDASTHTEVRGSEIKFSTTAFASSVDKTIPERSLSTKGAVFAPGRARGNT